MLKDNFLLFLHFESCSLSSLNIYIGIYISVLFKDSKAYISKLLFRKLFSFRIFVLKKQQFVSCVCAKSLQSCPIWCNPMDGSHQAALSMGFSRQEHWSGLPCPPPGDPPNPRTEPTSLQSPASVVGFFTTSATWEASGLCQFYY